jgi:hypothetical protein
MRYPVFIFIFFLVACNQQKTQNQVVEKTNEPLLYELRIYYAATGKLDELLNRFEDHTMAIFEKYDMINLAYWTPVINDDNQLIYLLGHSNKQSRDESWARFREDPDWNRVKKESEINGKLVDSIQTIFLVGTDYSPDFKVENKDSRVFEMRTYFTNSGKLPDLHSRFRDHTMKLFENNGMTNIAYFDLTESNSTLLYMITHPDTVQAKINWTSFLNDPKWQSVYRNSIQNGKLVDSIASIYLKPTRFSPLK